MNKDLRHKALLIGLIIMIASLAGCGGGGSTPVYKVHGVGVIIESKSSSSISSISKSSYFNPAWKRIDLSLDSFTGVQSQPALGFRAASVTDADLSSNVSFILLTWDVVSGAGHYQVFYQDNMVWDSDNENIADPTFIPSNPQAYLDLDGELSGKITTAGQYEFQIVALQGSTVIVGLPKVTASLGMVLETFPGNVSFASPNLTWDAVTAVSEYKITFNRGDGFIVNNSTPSYNVGTVLTEASQYYEVWVDARYLDSGGNLVEMTRVIDGFTY